MRLDEVKTVDELIHLAKDRVRLYANDNEYPFGSIVLPTLDDSCIIVTDNGFAMNAVDRPYAFNEVFTTKEEADKAGKVLMVKWLKEELSKVETDAPARKPEQLEMTFRKQRRNARHAVSVELDGEIEPIVFSNFARAIQWAAGIVDIQGNRWDKVLSADETLKKLYWRTLASAKTDVKRKVQVYLDALLEAEKHAGLSHGICSVSVVGMDGGKYTAKRDEK